MKEKSYGIAVALCTVAATVLVYSSGFQSFMDPKWLALSMGAVLVGLVMMTRAEGGWPSPFRLIWWALLCAVAVRLLGPPPASWPAMWLAVAEATLLLVSAELMLQVMAGEKRTVLWTAFYWSGVGAAAVALLHYSGVLDLVLPPRPEYGQPMYGVFGNQSIGAGYFAAVMPMALVLNGERQRWPVAIGAGLLACAVVLSGSRGAWIAGVVGLVIGFAFAREKVWRQPLAPVLVVGVVVGLFSGATVLWVRLESFISGESGSLGLRLWFWDGAARMIEAHGVLGVGPGNYRMHSAVYQGEALWSPGGAHHMWNEVHTWHCHNDALELIAEYGWLPAALVALWLVRMLRTGPDPLWASLAALLVSSCFTPTLWFPPHGLLALCVGGYLMTRGQERVATYRGRGVLRWLVAAAAAGLVVYAGVVPSWEMRHAIDGQLNGKDATEALRGLAGRPLAMPAAAEKLGIAYMEQERYAEGLEAFDAAAAGGATHGDVALGQALCALYEGHRELAWNAARRCVAVWPGDRDGWAVVLACSDDGEWPGLKAESERWFSAVEWAEVEASALSLRQFLVAEH